MNGRHVQTGLLFVALCLLVGLGLAMYTMRGTDVPAANTSAAANEATAAAPADLAAPDAASADTQAAEPDFLVTEELRANKPAWEDLGVGPTETVFCQGAKAVLTNGSGRTLNLNVVVDESDDSSSLGSVRAGQSITFEPGEPGTWDLVDAGEGGPLFQYKVQRCTKDGSPIEEAASTDNQTITNKVGRCRLTVDGERVIDGTCHYAMHAGGGFSVSDTADDSGFVATLEVEDGEATGFWNGRRGGENINKPLGQGEALTRRGACWVADKDELCLWS